MNEKLQEIMGLIPMIKQMTGIDAGIGVWNKDGVVEAFFKSNSLNIIFEKGFQIPDKNDKLYEVLRTGRQAYNKIPKEVFGEAIEGTITPVFDGREVVGVVTYIFSTEEREEIISHANQLSYSISKTDHSISEITSGTVQLAENMTRVQEITEMVRNQVDEATKVVAAIQKNANYSNILALNASIESARAGQAGRGFAVVSDEMRKFSKMSGDSAAKINSNLEEMVKSLNEVKESIDRSAAIAAEQAHAANELNEMFGNVTVTADKVTEICKNAKHI